MEASRQLKLSVVQRIILINNLPIFNGGLVQMIIIRDLIKKFEITQQEIEDFKIKDIVEGNKKSIDYDVAAAQSFIDYSFTEKEICEIKNTLIRLDENKQITNDLVDLCIELEILIEE
jgi:hypothetical protein